jgi:hypothetical protein
MFFRGSVIEVGFEDEQFGKDNNKKHGSGRQDGNFDWGRISR